MSVLCDHVSLSGCSHCLIVSDWLVLDDPGKFQFASNREKLYSSRM